MPQANPEAAGRSARRKMRQGVVVSDKSDKTVVVKVERLVPHPLYKKVIKRSKKYHAHDEDNAGQTGDVVRIMESRPMSRTKRWRLMEVVKRARRD